MHGGMFSQAFGLLYAWHATHRCVQFRCSDDATFALQLPSATAGRLCLHQILNTLVLDLECGHVN